LKEVVVLALFAAMAGSWLFRFLLIRVLRLRHPEEFALIGEPTSRQLESLLPRHQEMHLQFWKYLWSGRPFLLGDWLVSALTTATLLSDLVLAGSVVSLFWLAE
jgi:hypothetical protein